MFLGKSGLAVGYNGVGMRTVGGPEPGPPTPMPLRHYRSASAHRPGPFPQEHYSLPFLPQPQLLKEPFHQLTAFFSPDAGDNFRPVVEPILLQQVQH